MNLQQMIRIFFVSAIALGAAGVSAAQTTDQAINVRIIPTTTVEERVANEAKEKELREKLAADEAARIQSTNPRALLSHARILFISSNTTYFEAVQLENALRKLLIPVIRQRITDDRTLDLPACSWGNAIV